MTSGVSDVDFGEMIRQSRRGCLIKPLVLNYIEAASELEVPALEKRDLGARDPDGWFHPSTHPLWPDRALYEYLAHPRRLVARRFDYAAKMAVTFGSAGHVFLQHVMREMGLLRPEDQVCASCPPEAGCQEPSWVDEDCGSRGHGDGVLDEDLLEIKFTNQNTWAGSKRLAALEDRADEEFIRIFPDYAAQGWEYQRMSGRRRTIVLMAIPGYPYEMREFHLVWDRERALATRDKYLRVRQAVADQRPPRCLCGTSERRTCLSRAACS